MKHIFKAGGIRKTESGTEYSIKAASDNECALLFKKGWFATLEELELSSEDKAEQDEKDNESAKEINAELEQLKLELKASQDEIKATNARIEAEKKEEQAAENSRIEAEKLAEKAEKKKK